MKILILTPYIPYPLDSGGNQAVFTMLSAMAERHEVTVIARGDIRKDSIRIPLEELRKALPGVRFITFPYTKNKRLRFFCRIPEADPMAAMLRSRTTIPWRDAMRLRDLDFYEYVAKITSEEHFDLIQAEFYESLPVVYFLPENVKKVFVHHEIRFIRNHNEISLMENPTLYDRVAVDKEMDLEIGMLRRFDHVITLTETDRAILSEYLDPSRIYVSPAIVKMSAVKPFKECSTDLVFVGSSSHYPNMDGMFWFCENVLPRLRPKLPGVKIYITGEWDKAAKKKLSAENPELVFCGFVPNIQDFVNGKISIAPIRIGSGMRMKVSDAIMGSSPVVITSKGIEGQVFENGKDCIIADDPTEMASEIAALAADKKLQRAITKSAYEKMQMLSNPHEMVERRLYFYDYICAQK